MEFTVEFVGTFLVGLLLTGIVVAKGIRAASMAFESIYKVSL